MLLWLMNLDFAGSEAGGITSPRQTDSYIPSVPVEWSSPAEHRRKIAQGAELALEGKVRSVGTVTLTANDTSTTISDRRIGPGSFIGLMPTTSNAAGAIATTYISARTNESATVTHASNAQTDKTFIYVVLG